MAVCLSICYMSRPILHLVYVKSYHYIYQVIISIVSYHYVNNMYSHYAAPAATGRPCDVRRPMIAGPRPGDVWTDRNCLCCWPAVYKVRSAFDWHTAADAARPAQCASQ